MNNRLDFASKFNLIVLTVESVSMNYLKADLKFN